MYILRFLLASLLLGPSFIFASLNGPTNPVPVDLTSDESLVSNAWKEVTAKLDQLSANDDEIKGLTFSTGLFSVNDPGASRLQIHHTSSEVALEPNGTVHVDGDTIYHVASISKVITVLVGLLELSDDQWNQPLTDYIPAFAEYAQQTSGNDDFILRTQWSEITAWSLASQIAGIPWAYLSESDRYGKYLLGGKDPIKDYGFPPPPGNISDFGPCFTPNANPYFPECTISQYVQTLPLTEPRLLPWSTPAYADTGFFLLGIAISHLVGRPITSIYDELVLKPLGMDSTLVFPPKNGEPLARSAVVDYNQFISGDLITIPSGGILSTINDLAKLGTALLNSTLLPASRTRKWMKPSSQTASLNYAFGAPWEIMRYVHPGNGKITELYTKSGSSGLYGGWLIVIPDYNAGFSILSTSSNSEQRPHTQNLISDLITNTVVPALEAQAAAEALKNYVGTYVSEDMGKLNSSITISFNDSKITAPSASLTLAEWVSNGTDVLASDLFHISKNERARLLPAIPMSGPEAVRPSHTSFLASTQPQKSAYNEQTSERLGLTGLFTGWSENNDVFAIAEDTYLNRQVSGFVFELDEKGKAIALTPDATKSRLRRLA